MSIDLDCFCLHSSFMMEVATLLSNWMGTGPCGCPISSSARMLGTSSLALMYPAPVSASCALDITVPIIFEMTNVGALCGGGLSDSRIGRVGALDKNGNPLPVSVLWTHRGRRRRCGTRVAFRLQRSGLLRWDVLPRSRGSG